MNELTTTTDTNVGTMNMLMNPGALQALVGFSELMAKSAVTVPQHLRGKPSDCMAIAMQAAQWGMNPFVVAQKTHIVNGALGYEAQLVIAVVQASGAIQGGFKYEHRGIGMDMECRVGAVLRGESEITWGNWLRNGDVTTRNSPLWKVNPAQQLGYLQAKNWTRLHAPGALLGVYSTDELEDSPVRDMGYVDEVAPAPTGPRRRSELAAVAHQIDAVNTETGEVPAPAAAPAQATPAAPVAAAANTGSTASGSLTGGQVAYLRNKMRAAGLEEVTACDRFQVASIELLSVDQFDTLKAELLAMV